jgi:hypothetical protein
MIWVPELVTASYTKAPVVTMEELAVFVGYE